MIPKVIHYCWFGRGELSPLAEKCIESWRIYLPDYKLILWNEETFDVYENLFTKEAYLSKRYAFVTDYVRLYAIYNYGGIYMDTDVEVLKSLNVFLNLPSFSGFETDTAIPTGLMGSEQYGEWAKVQLSYYDHIPFIFWNGKYNDATNVHIITTSMLKLGLIPNNSYQIINNYFHLFPKDYFCPKSYLTNEITITDRTYCIHHFAGSWKPMATNNSFMFIFFGRYLSLKNRFRNVLKKIQFYFLR